MTLTGRRTLTARVISADGNPVAATAPARNLSKWAKGLILVVIASLFAVFAVSVGQAVSGQTQEQVMLAGCVGGADHYNNTPVPSSFMTIAMGSGGQRTWNNHYDASGNVQYSPTSASKLPYTAYEWYGSYFPFTSTYKPTDNLEAGNPTLCGTPEGWLGSTIPSLIFAIGSALTTVLIAVYTWSTDPNLLNSLIAPIDCIVAGSSANTEVDFRSVTAESLGNFNDSAAASAMLNDAFPQGKSVCPATAKGLVNVLYLPYMVPVIFIAAIWMFWQGAVKRRSSQVLQGVLWMVGVGALSIVFLIQPTFLAVKINEGISYINNTVTTEIMSATTPPSQQDVCYLDDAAIIAAQPNLGSARPGLTSEAYAQYAYMATSNYYKQVNSIGPRRASCILWKTLVYDAWATGQFGSVESANVTLDTTPADGGVGNQPVVTYDSDGNPTLKDVPLTYSDNTSEGDWAERRARTGDALKMKFGDDYIPTVGMAQLEVTVLDHDEMVLITNPPTARTPVGAGAGTPEQEPKYLIVPPGPDEDITASTCYAVDPKTNQVGSTSTACPDLNKFTPDYAAWLGDGGGKTENLTSVDTANPPATGIELCVVPSTGILTGCGTSAVTVGSAKQVFNDNAYDDFAALAEQLTDTDVNASWAKLWAGHSPSQRYSAAVTAVVGALIGGIVVTVLGFLNVLYQIGMMLLIVIAPLILLVGLHPGVGRRVTIKWLEALLSTATKRVLVSFLLAILVAIYGSIYAMDVGWLQKVLLIAAVGIGLLMYRKQLTQMIGTVNFGSGGADSFNQGAQQAQRRVMGGATGGGAAMVGAAVAGGGVGAVIGAGARGATQSRGGGPIMSTRTGMTSGAAQGRRSKAKKNAQRRQKQQQQNAGPAGGGRPTRSTPNPGRGNANAGGPGGRGPNSGGPGGTGRPPSGGGPGGGTLPTSPNAGGGSPVANPRPQGDPNAEVAAGAAQAGAGAAATAGNVAAQNYPAAAASAAQSAQGVGRMGKGTVDSLKDEFSDDKPSGGGAGARRPKPDGGDPSGTRRPTPRDDDSGTP